LSFFYVPLVLSMGVFCDTDLSALARALDQQVPRYCQRLGILSILGDIAAPDYDLGNGD
jgi:hypothetical protein